MTVAHQLTAADMWRRVRYTDSGTPHELRVTSLERTSHDGHSYVELAHGHEVHPQMPVELLPDDRVHEPGIYTAMEEGVYHGDPVRHLGGSLSASMCKTLARPGGPAKLRQQLDHPEPPKVAFDVGQAAHRIVLGVGADLTLIPHEEWRSREAKAAVAEARQAGRVPLKPRDYDAVHRMAEKIAEHPVASELLVGVTPEVSMFRQHEGLWLRSRLDGLGEGYIADYKTAASADPDVFARDAAKWGYHLQDAFYRDMVSALIGGESDFYFIVQEKVAPFLVSVIELSPAYLDLGRSEVARAIDLWRECTETGQWPGYSPDVTTIHPPAWLAARQREELDPAIEAAFADLLGGVA